MGRSVLVDTSSDFARQALRGNIRYLDAVLITHCHVDHVFGLDDIRPLNFRYGAMPIFANETAWVDLRRIFQYIFIQTDIFRRRIAAVDPAHRLQPLAFLYRRRDSR